MKKITYASLIATLTLAGFTAGAQDIHFSQVLETQMYQSPANTGFFNGYFRGSVNYRNQWASMNKAFQTYALAVDGGLFRSRKRPAFMGLGLTMFRDQAGAGRLARTNVMLNVSGLVHLGRHSSLSAGLAGGTTAMNAKYNQLTYESQFEGNYLDPSLNSGEPVYRQSTAVDVAAGLAYEFASSSRDSDHDDVRQFKIALGAYHLNKPVQDFGPGSAYRMPVRYTAALTSLFDIEDTRFSITPTFVYYSQAKFEEYIMGTYLKYRMSTGTKVTGTRVQNAMGFGLFYRKGDALIPALSCDIGDYSFGLSYDINLSGYRAASRYMGGFEISLRYNNLASALFETRREFR